MRPLALGIDWLFELAAGVLFGALAVAGVAGLVVALLVVAGVLR